MSLRMLFWLLMIIWLLFGLYWSWPMEGHYVFAPIGNHLLIWILFFLVGWKVFGFPISES